MADNNVFDFFYDAQIRRYLLQFIRIFSLIKIETAPDENGVVTQSTVPIRYGDTTRLIETIRRQNSENTALPANIMSVWITNLAPDDANRLNPFHVGKINVDEREFDGEQYTENMGHQYSIERYMPSPYKLSLQLDVFTSNTTTKFQILEQILMIFNPSVQIQQNDNLLDWSTMFDVKLSTINWSNRTIGAQGDSERDVASLNFDIGIWINPPAKAKRKKLIEQIVTNVYEVSDMSDVEIDKFVLDPIKNCFDQIDQIVVTPGNYKVKIGFDGAGPTELVLLNDAGEVEQELTWETLFNSYGEFQPGVTTITLKTDSDIEENSGDVVGTVVYDDNDATKLVFTVDEDTLPAIISSGPIDQIINPLNAYPGNNLPAASAGQRYLLLNDIPDNTGANPWGFVSGRENDIIEYDGTNWFISFDSSNEVDNQYVKSLSSFQHYKFTISDGWVHTYFGEYNPGFWRITMQSC